MQEQGNIIFLDSKLILAKVFQLSVFVALAVLAPYFSNQLITGSIVNALLFISASTLGIESAILLCLIPSLISIYIGLLPLALAGMVPFIMTGNALLVLVFTGLKKRGFWLGAILAALAKFIFIFGAGMILAKPLLMISWPQLATAIAGAAIAFLFLKTIKKI